MSADPTSFDFNAGVSEPASLDPVNVNLDQGTVDLSTLGNPFSSDTGGSPIQNLSPDLTSFSPPDATISGGTTTAAPAGGAGGTSGSVLGGLLGGGNLLSDIAGLGLGAYGLSEAAAAGKQTSAEIQPLKSTSNSLLGESQSLLSQYNSGKLPSWAQSYVDWTSTEANNVLNSGSTQALQKIASQNFTDYSSGTLKPADETSLQQQTAAQKQQVASQLASGGQIDSSVLSAQYQQIDNQAQVTRQAILNSYFQTGDSAYNSWLNANTQATQIKTLGANYAQQTFTNMMQEAISSAQVGDQALSQAIGLELQSDAILSQQVSGIMQGLATAFAYSAANRGYGGYGGGGAGGSGGPNDSWLGALVGNVERWGGEAWNGISSLWSGGGAGLSSAWGTGAAADQALSQAGFSGAGGQAASQTAGATAGSYLGEAMGALGAGLSLYSEVQNYQSGATGSDTLSGAETGAAIGTAILPGVGTVIGGALGAVGGAIASAFGGGRTDPETIGWDNIAPQLNSNPQMASTMTGAQAYQALAGMMDAKDNSPGHSTNLELKFGRMGEGAVVDQMANWVNQAIQKNPQLKNASPSQLYASVVKPQLQAMGAYVNPTDIITKNGTQAGGAVDAVLTQLIALWQGGQLNSSSQVGISGQTIGGLPNYV